MEYHVNESDMVLVDEFSLFVKGESLGVEPTLPGLPGTIGSVAVTAKGWFYGSTMCFATPYDQFLASDVANMYYFTTPLIILPILCEVERKLLQNMCYTSDCGCTARCSLSLKA